MVGRIAEAAVATERSGKPVFLIDIDIDRFKQINDSIGYQSGDELIRAFGHRLKENLPHGVSIGRMGAGEFVAVVPDGKTPMRVLQQRTVNRTWVADESGRFALDSAVPDDQIILVQAQIQ